MVASVCTRAYPPTRRRSRSRVLAARVRPTEKAHTVAAMHSSAGANSHASGSWAECTRSPTSSDATAPTARRPEQASAPSQSARSRRFLSGGPLSRLRRRALASMQPRHSQRMTRSRTIVRKSRDGPAGMASVQMQRGRLRLDASAVHSQCSRSVRFEGIVMLSWEGGGAIRLTHHRLIASPPRRLGARPACHQPPLTPIAPLIPTCTVCQSTARRAVSVKLLCQSPRTFHPAAHPALQGHFRALDRG